MTEKTLRILHFNDGYEFERTPFFVRQYLNRVNDATLKIFSGDILSPSFISNTLEGRQYIPFFKKIGIDAMVPGNHEFDFGIERFQEITHEAGIEWLMCNLMCKKISENFLDCKDFYIRTVGNLKVGMFGIVDQSFIDTSNLDETKYDLIDPIEKTKEMAAYLRSEGCEIIIAITHTDNPTDFEILNNEDIDVDFILGGHIHVFLAKRFKNKLMLKSGFDFITFSEINVQKIESLEENADGLSEETLMNEADLKADKVSYFINKNVNGKKVAFKVDLIRHHVDDKNGEFDAELKTETGKIIERLSKDCLIPLSVFQDEVNLKAAYIRANETQFKNLTCDVMRIELEADVVMLNSGHFRPETSFSKEHIYRSGDLMKTFPLICPFSISLAKAKDIIITLEQGLSGYPTPKGCYPNLSGMSIEYDPSQPEMGRVVTDSVTINNKQVDWDKIYTLSTLAIIGKGKDGFTHLAGLVKTPCIEITACKAMNHFLLLPSNEANREEFNLTKPFLQGKNLNEFMVLLKKSDHFNKTITRVTKNDIKDENVDFDFVFSSLTKEAQKRIMMYKLAEEIREIEGHFVFIFDPKFDERVKRI